MREYSIPIKITIPVHDMDTQEKKITKFQITGLGLSVLGSDEEVKNELPYI